MTGLALLLSLSLRSMSVVLPDGDTSTLLLLLEAYYGPNYQVIFFGFLTEKMFFCILQLMQLVQKRREYQLCIKPNVIR